MTCDAQLGRDPNVFWALFARNVNYLFLPFSREIRTFVQSFFQNLCRSKRLLLMVVVKNGLDVYR